MKMSKHIWQSVASVFAAMYSLGGTPASYAATSANALTAAAWRQTGASLRTAMREADGGSATAGTASGK